MVVTVTAYEWMGRLLVHARVVQTTPGRVESVDSRDGDALLEGLGLETDSDILARVGEVLLDLAYRDSPF